MSSLGQRLREERLKLELTQEPFGALMKVGKQSQINYESGKRVPDASYLILLAEIGIDVLYVLTGRRTPNDLARGLQARSTQVARIMAAANTASEENVDDHESSSTPVAQTLPFRSQAYARIPLHDALLSAGPGAVLSDDAPIVDHLAFRQDWLRKVGISPTDAAVARVFGESMAPSIQDGDLVLIDTKRIGLTGGKPGLRPDQLPIFAFIQDGQARVKRIEYRETEQLLILYSDNKDFAAEIVPSSLATSITILGEVVWSSHVWR